jgi:protoporphyrinogen oxidase
VLRSGASRVVGQRGAAPARGSTFLYPRRGFGQITEALEQAARRAGAQVHTGVEVQRIRPAAEVVGGEVVGGEVVGGALVGGGDVVVETGDGRRWRAPRVFSTLPIPLLARLCPDRVPPEVSEAAQGLRFRAMVLVYLTHAPGTPAHGSPVRWSPYDAHYLPAGATPVTRISEPANYRDSDEDPRDRTVLCAEIPCDVGDAIWTADEGALAEVVAEALREVSLPPVHGPGGADPAVHVRRLPAVYPVYEQGFAARLSRLEDWADALPGVTTLGRSGLFAHDNTHHAMVMARAAVAALGHDATFDEPAWRRSRQSFRDHVVED